MSTRQHFIYRDEMQPIIAPSLTSFLLGEAGMETWENLGRLQRTRYKTCQTMTRSGRNAVSQLHCHARLQMRTSMLERFADG
jgi:hypothetical protein